MKTGIMGDAFLDTLASNKDRQFLKEGDLIKVCRKSNKTFRFWLFSDYVMYGAKYVGTDKFEFHRSIKLDETVVKQGGEGENSLMVSSKEKVRTCKDEAKATATLSDPTSSLPSLVAELCVALLHKV